MPVTLKTIAQKTGFSITTVSRALGGYDDVAESTRQLILETAQALGYQPNAAAQRLKRLRANTIGLIIPTFGPRFSDPFFSELLAGIGNQSAERQFDLLVGTQAPGPNEIDAYRRMESGRVDGLIVVRTRQNDVRIYHLQETGMPFVAFGRCDEAQDFPYVDVDGEVGMQKMVQHLVDLGHRRIGYIAPPPELNFSQHRIAGYATALKMNGIPYDAALVIYGDLTQQSGAAGAVYLLGIDPPLTAILAGNDTMALGAMSTVRERGFVVGKDIAVGGFDDVPDAEYAHPPLTTLRQPIYDIGRQTCDMLINIIQGIPLSEIQVLLEPELIIRKSTG
ncbi:MAG: LacI family DNA-binding transcriptional regulator [Anaerolineae bacterium]|nr:LacI family DNA-binding transcriptional regulator [Anaerolineae bacterium]